MNPSGDSSLTAHIPGDAFQSISRTEVVTRVLLVDDDEDEFLITKELLREAEEAGNHIGRSRRFELDWVSHYNAGLDSIRRGEHDVYLIDYRLGPASGLDLLKAAQSEGCRRPIILMTGQGDPFVDAEATLAGAADYIIKDQVDGPLLERSIRYAIAQKGAQERLLAAVEQNARLSAAVDNATVGLAMVNVRKPGAPITYVNREFSRITGWAFEEAQSQSLNILIGPETDPEAMAEARSRIAAGKPFHATAIGYRKDGSAFWADMQTWPVRDGDEVVAHVAFISDVTQRIKAERALRESRADLEAAQHLTHIGSWALQLVSLTHLNSNPIKWSNECFSILGLDELRVEPSHSVFLACFHPEDRPRAAAALRHAIQGQDSYDLEVRVVRPDGEQRIVQLQAEIERDPVTDAPLRAVGTIWDVTERVRAEAALRQSRERLQTALQGAPLIIWSCDEQGTFTLAEGRPLNSIRQEARPQVGGSAFKLFADYPEALSVVRDGLDGQSGSRLVELDGLNFDVRYAPERDQHSRVIGVSGVALDVTEQLRAQRAERESEERFYRMVANVPGMVYRFRRLSDGEYAFDFVSEGSRYVYGMEPEELRSDFYIVTRMMHEPDRVRLLHSIEESASTLKPCVYEGRIHTSLGEKWVRSMSRPVMQDNGIIVWDGIMMDVTESKRAEERLRQSEAQLAQAQQIAHIGSWEWIPERDYSTWSPEMCRIFGVGEETMHFSLSEGLKLIHPDDQERCRTSMLNYHQVQGEARFQWRLIRATDGAVRVVQVHFNVERNEDNRPVRVIGTCQDITGSVEAATALRESEERYALAAQGANDGLWDWDLGKGRIYLSPRWKNMAGLEPDSVGDDPEEWFSRVHPEDLDRLRGQLTMHFSGDSAHFECEYRLKHATGGFRWMVSRGLCVRDANGHAYRIAGSQTDITERKRAEEQLAHNAFFDSLTNLPNRSLFIDRLDRTISRARRRPENAFAVLFLDIDRFKKINDSLGHMPGDTLLIEAAKRFESCLRPGDTVARLGGDEFAILLDELTDQAQATRVAERIQRELLRPFDLGQKEVFVSVSIGIAFSRGGDERPDELLRNADTAMYRAKSLGRARHEIFDAAMHQRAVRMLELESDLWRALDRNELRLHYQPIVNLDSGRVAGFEALIRWQHPTRGLVSPGDFIPLAEETGLIVPIGWWVMNEACRQIRLWQPLWETETPLFVSVNLSTKQFSQEDLIERVKTAVELHSLDPRTLKLEITESVIMENTDSASAALLELKELGVQLSMDDFGTGYSSLSYLHRFPLDTLKIDRSFVSGMQSHKRNVEIVGTILSLANGLSMTVVAEGVEAKEQLEQLCELRCGYGQGFYFSRPLAPDVMEEFMAKGPQW